MRITTLLLVLLATILTSSSTLGDTTFVLVRHAEKKIDSSEPDVPLSFKGEQRARDLVRLLQHIELDSIYATTIPLEDQGPLAVKRTWDTALPISKAQAVSVKGYDAGDIDGVLDHAFENHRGGSVLIVGHSNTVPELIEALGVRTPVALDDSDYDDVFIVTVRDDGSSTMLHLHYGETDE
ncbi:MAG: SixA phosphatase family protein [Phycisphaerales bacterium JB043]